MRFFTRDLYERGQSTIDDIVDAAEDEWELANQRYEEHLQAIGPQLPPHVPPSTICCCTTRWSS